MLVDTCQRAIRRVSTALKRATCATFLAASAHQSQRLGFGRCLSSRLGPGKQRRNQVPKSLKRMEPAPQLHLVQIVPFAQFTSSQAGTRSTDKAASEKTPWQTDCAYFVGESIYQPRGPRFHQAVLVCGCGRLEAMQAQAHDRRMCSISIGSGHKLPNQTFPKR